jgi:hypothetical protein
LSLSAELRKQRSTLTNKGTLFEGTGIHFPSPGVVQVDGAMQVTGSLDVDSTINVDGDATFNGDTTIGGNAAITGTLSLPAGIIDNDALANPVVPQSIWRGTTANFGLTVAWAATVSETVTIPSGCTKLLAFATTRLVAENTTASSDAMYSDMDIGGDSAGGFSLEVEPGKSGQSSTTFSRLMTGLTPGGSVALTAYASSGSANWPAPSNANVQQFGAILIWLR